METTYGLRSECVKQVAINQQNPSLCSEIDIPEGAGRPVHIQECVAVSERNLTKCEQINHEQVRDACFGRLAQLNLNMSICSKISGNYPRYSYSNIMDCVNKVNKSINPDAKCTSVVDCLGVLGIIEVNPLYSEDYADQVLKEINKIISNENLSEQEKKEQVQKLGISKNASDNCFDTDGGKDYFTPGNTSRVLFANKFITWQDICKKDNYGYSTPEIEKILVEGYCEYGIGFTENHVCAISCEKGACTS
jgi:hypothetical protein